MNKEDSFILKMKSNRGTIDQSSHTLELNKIRSATINLVDKISLSFEQTNNIDRIQLPKDL